VAAGADAVVEVDATVSASISAAGAGEDARATVINEALLLLACWLAELCLPRFDSLRTHSTLSRRQFVHGIPPLTTSHRTLRSRQEMQALGARLFAGRFTVWFPVPLLIVDGAYLSHDAGRFRGTSLCGLASGLLEACGPAPASLGSLSGDIIGSCCTRTLAFECSG
jgi:hypothetical protein